MAEVIAKYDTVTKKLTVTKDGKTLGDIQYVSLGRKYDYEEGEMSEDQFGMCIQIGVEDEESDTRTFTSICASADGSLVEKQAKVKASEDDTDLQDEICDYLNIKDK